MMQDKSRQLERLAGSRVCAIELVGLQPGEPDWCPKARSAFCRRPSQCGWDVSIYFQDDLPVADLGAVQDQVEELFLFEWLEIVIDVGTSLWLRWVNFSGILFSYSSEA
jgi:hypothetical protein